MVDTRFSVSIHIMTVLAYHQGELMNSDMLAQSMKTNATFIRKLIARLVSAKLVESFRGKGGGIRLAKEPHKISLKEIYLAAMDDKPLVSTPNKSSYKTCPVSCSMNKILCDVIDGMEATTMNYLAKQHLSDLVTKIKHN